MVETRGQLVASLDWVTQATCVQKMLRTMWLREAMWLHDYVYVEKQELVLDKGLFDFDSKYGCTPAAMFGPNLSFE